MVICIAVVVSFLLTGGKFELVVLRFFKMAVVVAVVNWWYRLTVTGRGIVPTPALKYVTVLL
jgi:hypothetical protein